MTDSPKPKKKTEQVAFTRRDALNFAVASAVAVLTWFVVLDFLFEPLDLYDPLEAFAPWMPGLVICATFGFAVGGAQSGVLPPSPHRRAWFWGSSAAAGFGFLIFWVISDDGRNVIFVSGLREIIGSIVLYLVSAAPLIVLHTRLLSRMADDVRSTDPRKMLGIIMRFVPVYCLSALMLAMPAFASAVGVMVSVVVWSTGCAWVMLNLLSVSEAST